MATEARSGASGLSEPITMIERDQARSEPIWPGAEHVVRLLDGRWTIRLLTELGHGPRRYQELFDILNGVSHKVLSETLRRAERDGLIIRILDTDRRRASTVYQVTEVTRSLDTTLALLAAWANEHWPIIDTARQTWDQRAD
jgi:DNA-binding HxlR family transcriptional regulator